MGAMISRLDSVDDNLTVYVSFGEVISPDSPIELVDEETDAPSEGMTYLLEVNLVKDVVTVWREWRGGRNPDLRQACEAVAYYASHDAFQPVDW
ncbi:hypothetical protein [Amycolatopsis sp. NPDC051372]|uniref:hypothetical protein n=1 Tax=Amycolatopsis sp. NPDC051372 TaxID=3155669 RepID=UPI003444AF54